MVEFPCLNLNLRMKIAIRMVNVKPVIGMYGF